MKRETESEIIPLGSTLPDFSLPATDGSTFDSSKIEIDKAFLVVFTCNHCPYVKGSEEQLVEIFSQFQSSGLSAIAISANDAEKYPDDSFENMKLKTLPYPYLYDQSQQVAKSFDAACTPECFLYNADKKLAYHGAINNSPNNPAGVTDVPLKSAIEALVAGNVPEKSFVHPVGCSIKWK